MPLRRISFIKPVDEVWLLYKASGSNKEIGAWPNFRDFNKYAFAIVCRCNSLEAERDSRELGHNFYTLNCKSITYRYKRNVEVISGSYILEDGKESLTVRARPGSLSGVYSSDEGRCGVVVPNWVASVIVTTKLVPSSKNAPRCEPIVCTLVKP